MGKLINRIPEACQAIQHAFSMPSLVNLISKDTHLVFSIYSAVYSEQSMTGKFHSHRPAKPQMLIHSYYLKKKASYCMKLGCFETVDIYMMP